MNRFSKTFATLTALFILGATGAVVTAAPASAAAGCQNWKATQNFRTTAAHGMQVQLTRVCWNTHDKTWTEYKWVGV